ncbi:chromatin remodeling protein SHL-like protein [Tanacetum coccineum]
MPPKPGMRSYVGKVSKFILNDTTNEVKVKGVYYYRPEDIKKVQTMPFIGKNEVFISSEKLSESAESIERTCKVLSEHDYSNLKIVDDAMFFQRLRYDHIKKDFETNATLKVFCKCKLPYNPDYPMIQCEKCNEWYHPRCVNINTQSKCTGR